MPEMGKAVRLIFRLLLVATTLSLSASLSIECEFIDYEFFVIGKRYTCSAKPQAVVGTDNEVTEVTGNENINIKGLILDQMSFERLPRAFNKFFPNIEALQANSVGLRLLTKCDLIPFPNLKFLNIYNNKLEILPGNLFTANPNIEYLSMNSNKLQMIGPGLIAPLFKLKELQLHTYMCVNVEGKTKAELTNASSIITESCSKPDMFNDAAYRSIHNENCQFHELQKLQHENAKCLQEKAKNPEIVALKQQLLRFKRKYEGMQRQNEAFKVNIQKLHNEKFIQKSSDELREKLSQVEFLNYQLQVDNKKQADEINQLQIFKTELSSIDLQCKTTKSNEDVICDAQNLRIFQPDIEVYQLHAEGKVETLNIMNQNTVWLPLRIGASCKGLLKKLTVTHSNLMVLVAEQFEDMDFLETLQVSNNEIEDIAVGTFKSLRKLESFDASFNSIEELDVDTFSSMHLLKKAQLHNNNIAKLLSGTFRNNKQLVAITLQDNRIKSIGVNLFDSLLRIRKIDFSNNICINIIYPSRFPVTSVKALKALVQNTCKFYIHFCCQWQASISDNICRIDGLNVLDSNAQLATVRFSEDCNMETEAEQDEYHTERALKVTSLQISKQNVHFLPTNLSTFFSNLQELSVEKCNLRVISNDAIAGLRELMKLSVKENAIEAIEGEAFRDNINLQFIDISRNKLAELPSNLLDNLKNLQSFDASHNRLKVISNSIFSRNNKLKSIYFNDNNLSKIFTNFIGNFASLKLVDLQHNECIDEKFVDAKISLIKQKVASLC